MNIDSDVPDEQGSLEQPNVGISPKGADGPSWILLKRP